MPRLLRSIQWAGTLLAILSLGGCGLPDGGARSTTTAIKSEAGTKLANYAQGRVAAHPGRSGLHALPDARDAFAARVALADAAQRSLDVQYFIWHQDVCGKILLERLLQAADRGARVRLLLDDLGTAPSDPVLLAIDSHPNLEVRMFNPVALRSMRMLGIVGDIVRINRRMHNKSFTADGHVSIVGGRNIADEYFAASAGANFADLDVVLIGPAVKEVSNTFDLYWNHPTAVPITALSRKNMSAEKIAAQRAALVSHRHTQGESTYGKSVRNSDFARHLRNRDIPFTWGKATIVSDHPDKVLTSSSKTETHLAPKLRDVLYATKRELFLITPYFVPGKGGVDLLVGARKRGARVVVVTNSLASTDGIPVHAKYQRYRKDLLRAGVELYELKPTSGADRAKHGGRGFFGSVAASGSSGSSLHAKTFSFDRRIGFVGSYNLDPRSSRLNTEMGVLFDCPPMVKRMPETTERDLSTNAYRLELEGRQVVWVTQEGEKEVRFHSEPETSLWKRAKVRVISWLPIEGLL